MGIAQYFASFAEQDIHLNEHSVVIFDGCIGSVFNVNGFTSSEFHTINGNTFLGYSDIAAQASSELDVAISDITSRSGGVLLSSLDNQILSPGIYTATASGGEFLYLDSTATVILDAAGDADAVWIFQINGSMWLQGSISIINLPGYLANGSFPVPVWWNPTGDAVLGVDGGNVTHIVGNILTNGAIRLFGDLGTIEGSLLSKKTLSVEADAKLTCLAPNFPNNFPDLYSTRGTCLPSFDCFVQD
jgi:hypothetical protein